MKIEGQNIALSPEETISSENETILCVAHDQSSMDVASDLLQRSGYRIIDVRSEDNALAVYRTEKKSINLVIYNLSPPTIEGYRRLNALYRLNPKVKVIVISDYSPDRSKIKALESGHAAFMSRPYIFTEMLRRIRAMI